jgi:hypothetical protein
MPSSQNTNQSTSQAFAWMMNQGWLVSVAGPGTSELGVVATDTMSFNSQGIEFLHGGTAQVPSWGTWAPTSDPNVLTGLTSSLQPFTIVRSVSNGATVLTCTLDSGTSQARRVRGIALGIVAGAVAGAVTGGLTGFRLLASAAVAALVSSTVTDSGQGHRDGPIPTWVASDGPPGRPFPQPGPHCLELASA